MPTVSREDLLETLEAVEPGLARREIVEQSTAFIFTAGKVMTFNEEVLCYAPSPIGGLEGAVQARKLLKLLHDMEEDSLEVEFGEKELLVKGINKETGVKKQSEILLGVANVERPKKADWRKLKPDFVDAMKMVQACAGKDEQKATQTCVHMTSEFVEAGSDHQFIRFKIKTDIEEEILVRASSVKHAVNLGVTKFAETENWLWFKNPAGYVVGCRRHLGDYPDLSEFYQVTGKPLTLPDGLDKAAKRAKTCSEENADDNMVTVRIKPGLLSIKGVGQTVWYRERKKLTDYKGPAMKLLVDPELLVELVQRHKRCEVSKEHALKVNGGRFTYVALLSPPDEGDE